MTTGKYVSVAKTNKKRVSVCGDGFSEDVLEIDETILDEYENELDLKKGKLFTVDESNIEKDADASYNNYDQLSVIDETCTSQTNIVLDSSVEQEPLKIKGNIMSFCAAFQWSIFIHFHGENESC